MIRKYFKRFLVWGGLIFGLILGSIFLRDQVIDSLDQQILDLEQEQRRITANISVIQNNTNSYAKIFLDNNKIDQYIPEGYNPLEIENKVVRKPVIVDNVNGKVVSYTISRDQPVSGLNLSKNIKAVRINLTAEFETEQQIYSYLNELHESIRSVYINTVKYSLPGENAKLPFVYSLEIEFFTFYYPVGK